MQESEGLTALKELRKQLAKADYTVSEYAVQC